MYDQISNIPRLLAKRLTHFLDINMLLPSRLLGFRKGFRTSDGLVCITHDMQVAFDAGYEFRGISLDFSFALDRANHKALLSKASFPGVSSQRPSDFGIHFPMTLSVLIIVRLK